MVETIAIGQAEDNKLTITLRGDAEALIKVLINGLPREALIQINDALVRELDARKAKP